MPEVLLSPAARWTIRREARASRDGNETGGVLLGFDADEHRPAVVTVAGGPGPNAVRRPDRFRRDSEYAQELADAACAVDASIWIGEWHTHPQGGSEPSHLDLSAYKRVLDSGVMPTLLSIIVVPSPFARLRRPRLHAWVIEPKRYQRVRLVDL